MEPTKEVQASAPFYIPFLVSLLRPRYTLERIYKALNTNALDQDDLDRFHEVCRSQKLRPCLLGTRGDYRTPFCQLAPPRPKQPSEPQASSSQDEFGLSNIFHVEKMCTVAVYIPMAGYTSFNLSEELQRRASRAKREQTVSATITKPGTRLVQFDWSDSIHTPIADQVVDELVSLPTAAQNEALLSDE